MTGEGVAGWVTDGRMKQELDDFLSFASDSPDTLVREDVMIVSSSQCLVRHTSQHLILAQTLTLMLLQFQYTQT